MNIRTKLTLAFLSVSLIVALVGSYAVSVSERALEAGIGEQSVVRAREMLARIDASIYVRIEQLRAYAERLAEDPALISSNQEFEGLADIQGYIAEKDRTWQAAEKDRITPFMAGLINSQLSRGIRLELEQKDFYRGQLGYELFSEVFVTNKYGANAAQTQKTSDYYQADEAWWQEAEKNGLYVEDVQYDRSAEVYSTDICIRVEDKEGNFLGVLKTVVDLEAAISCLKEADKAEIDEFKLLTADNRVIYATKGYSILEPLPEGPPFDARQHDVSVHMDYFIAKGDMPGEEEKLYAFAYSSGFKDYKGLGWTLVVEHDRKAILAPVATLRNRALGILLAVTALTVILGVFISRSVSNSLRKLTGAAVRIGEGDLSVRVETRSRDEVGQLTRVFNKMASSLQASRDTLEQDVTERKRAEEALRESEERFREVFENMGSGVAIYEAIDDGEDFIFRDINPAGVRSGRVNREDHLGKSVLYVYPGVKKLGLFAVFQEVWRTGIPHHHPLSVYEDERIVLWVENYVCRLPTGEVVAVYDDITDRKRAEEERLSLERQVQHAQKLESLGILAGGIAHDFNNFLMVILGNADLSLDELAPHAPARENIEEILKASKRAAELAKQMLAYSGKGRFVVEPIRLGELVEEMAHLLDVSVSKKAVLKYNFADNLPTFDGDATQIRQIIMNLITNASEAVGDKSGVIALSTGAMDCDRAYLDGVNETLLAGLDEPLPEGLYVYIEVADTGGGMDAETIERIFDPFFTTKFTGRGLGMAAVLGIARGHRGAIRIYSEVGKGTTFKILFPASELPENGAAIQKRDIGEAEGWQGHGTVLIADDEETVCAVGKKMLSRMGFSVLTAADGREAVEIFSEHTDEIVCVLLDLTMPHMDGEQAFRELRRIRPDVTVILCSGYNEQDATQHFTGKGLAGFIQKPYNMAKLRETLMEVLPDDRQAGSASGD